MSNDLNQCQFIGRLGKDPEVRYTSDGKAITHISIAVGESWKDKQTGQKQEKTEWVNCVFFGPLAVVVGDYVKKGSRIFVSGKMQTRKYTDSNGIEKYSTQVVVQGPGAIMQMLDSKQDGQQPQQPTQQYQQPQQPAQQTVDPDLNDDIPF